MKNKFLRIFLLLAGIVVFFGCEDDPTWLAETTDAPIAIKKIVDPNKWDAEISTANLDQVIKVIGTNLNNTDTIVNNDRGVERPLNAMLMNGALYIRIPYAAPKDRDDKLKITDKFGNTAEFPLKVTVPELKVTGMVCEYVPEGELLTIEGDYFDLYEFFAEPDEDDEDDAPEEPWSPSYVVFGDTEAPIVESSKTSIKVVVPQGTPKNCKLSLKNEIVPNANVPGRYMDQGEAFITDFEYDSFNDNYPDVAYVSGPDDPTENSHALPTDPKGVSGKYFRYKGLYPSGWNWWGIVYKSYTAPIGLAGHESEYALKFECYAVDPLTNAYVRLDSGATDESYRWGNDPDFPRGEWRTYTLPLSTFDHPDAFANGVFQIIFHQGGQYTEMYFCMDNFRISKLD